MLQNFLGDEIFDQTQASDACNEVQSSTYQNFSVKEIKGQKN